jgi:hypothetical protein
MATIEPPICGGIAASNKVTSVVRPRSPISPRVQNQDQKWRDDQFVAKSHRKQLALAGKLSGAKLQTDRHQR